MDVGVTIGIRASSYYTEDELNDLENNKMILMHIRALDVTQKYGFNWEKQMLAPMLPYSKQFNS